MSFLDELKVIDSLTRTENGAVAYSTTGNNVLDAFSTLGTMMNSSVNVIINTFMRAYNTDSKLATKLLFYMRDIRGGQGQRRVFRVICRYLANTHPDVIKNNLDNILFFGRGDDYLCLLGTPVEDDVIEYIRGVLYEDYESVLNGGSCSLLAKWLPSENTSSSDTRRYATIIRTKLGASPRDYRKMLSTLRKEIGIVESKMSANNWDAIDFSKLPAKASMIYSDAFMKHVETNYIDYLKALANGDSKVNANSLFPVDIVSKVLANRYDPKLKDIYLHDAMWKALPNYFEGLDETGICVVDTSGSMAGTPMEVALSLGLYCADKAKGPFKNHFITFSSKPKLQEIIGDTIYDKIRGMSCADWQMNTNVEAVFDLILNTAIKANLPQSELPSKLYLISDMQFDDANCSYEYDGWSSKRHASIDTNTLITTMRKKYEANGYKLPNLVYWNVRDSWSNGKFQQKSDENGCCMVSGYSASLFKSVITGTEIIEEVDEVTGEVVKKEKMDPITIMNNTLNNERYDRVWVA